MRNLALALLVAGGLAGLSAPSSAAPSTCPGVGNIGAGCNAIITVGTGGTSTITFPNTSPYDGSDDQLVGILNSSGSTLAGGTVTGTGIAGFDGDGAFQTGTGCITAGTNTFGCLGSGSSPGYGLTATQPDPNDYEGSGGNYVNTGGLRPDGSPAVSFVSIPNVNTVVISFLNGGLANGAFAYFSLETPPTAGGFNFTPGVPEPGSMALLGTALFGLYGLSRRRRIR